MRFQRVPVDFTIGKQNYFVVAICRWFRCLPDHLRRRYLRAARAQYSGWEALTPRGGERSAGGARTLAPDGTRVAIRLLGTKNGRTPRPSRAGTMIVLIGCTTIHFSRTRISKTFGQSFPVTNSLRPAASYAMPFITALRGSVGSGGMRDFSPARSSQPVT